MRRLRLFLLLAIAGLVLAACRVDAKVAIAVEEDGSGTVTVTVVLDRDAAQRLGDPATAVRLDDLRAAGWQVEDPATDAESGELTYRATRGFASPEQLPGVLAEIGGDDGPDGESGVFRDVRLEVSDGFGTTGYDFFSGIVLSGSLEQFSDPDLTAALGGLPLARTPEELAAEGGTGDAAGQLAVEVRMPGDISSTDGEKVDTADGEAARWEFPLANGEPTGTSMNSESSITQRAPVLLIGLGAVALVLALVALVAALLRRRA